jgi:hypothetical protein
MDPKDQIAQQLMGNAFDPNYRRRMQSHAMAGREPLPQDMARYNAGAGESEARAGNLAVAAGGLAALLGGGAFMGARTAATAMNPLLPPKTLFHTQPVQRTMAQKIGQRIGNMDPAYLVAPPAAVALTEGRNKFFGQQELGIAPWNWNEPGTLQHEIRNRDDPRYNTAKTERLQRHANDQWQGANEHSMRMRNMSMQLPSRPLPPDLSE